MSTPAKRLKEFLDYKVLKVSRFEKEIGSGNATIKKIIEEDREISSDIAQKVLTKYPELNRNWLLFGEGSMIKIDESLKDSKDAEIARLNQRVQELLESREKTQKELYQQLVEAYKEQRIPPEKLTAILDGITKILQKLDDTGT
jgi:plasmid maintenance system antidote protein VapI